MSKPREILLDDELDLLLDAYDGSPDQLINRLLADYFTEQSAKFKTQHGNYRTHKKLEFNPECKHPEHKMFVYCPYTPEQRRALGDKPL